MPDGSIDPGKAAAQWDRQTDPSKQRGPYAQALASRMGVCPASSSPVGLHAGQTYLRIMEDTARTSVLYNATCPVCNFEIQHYARYAGNNALPIRFDDLNSDARDAWGLDADTAARRLYVLHEGTLTSGIPAFLVLWSQMPKYQWLASVVGFPGIRQAASAAYDHILAPAIYNWHLHRLRRQTDRVPH